MKKRYQTANKQTGQVAIIILLLMVVLLTVGLSLASRTTQDLFLSQQESESARVFNAAEVGIEDALTQDFSSITGTVQLPDTNIVPDVTTETTITPENSVSTQIVEGAALEVNLAGYTGNMTINWGQENATCNTDVTNPGVASLLVSIYYEDAGTTKVIHEALTPCDRNPPDDFFTAGITDGEPGYHSQYTIDPPANPHFARVRAVYDGTTLKVDGSGSFPVQSFVIRASATTDVGEESRTVAVDRSLSGAPAIMDFAVYSGQDITIEDVP